MVSRLGAQGSGPRIPPHEEEGKSRPRGKPVPAPGGSGAPARPAPLPTFAIFPGKPPGGWPLPGLPNPPCSPEGEEGCDREAHLLLTVPACVSALPQDERSGAPQGWDLAGLF